MYRPLFTYPVLVATALLVLHSWLFRGRRNTLLFWGAGYLIAFAREYLYQNFFLTTYKFTGANLKLFEVPLTIPMGWLFEGYISLYLAQYIMGVDRGTMAAGHGQITARDYGKQVLPVIAFGCVIASTIAVAIEVVATKMGWWQLQQGSSGAMNPGWLTGHMFHLFWILTLLVYLMHEPLRLERNLLYVALALGLTVVVEMGFFPPRNPTWIRTTAFVVFGAHFAALFLWRQLLLFFLMCFVLPVAPGIVVGAAAEAGVLSSSGGPGTEHTFLALLWIMIVMSFYGMYLVRSRPPEQRISPKQLL